MEKYIPKSTLIAEIERLENKLYYEPDNFKDIGAKMALDSLKSALDNLEVKEVDLEKELSNYNRQYVDDNGFFDTMHLAKHFFELGINASNPLTWEDMMIIHKCCKDAMNHNLYAWETAEGQQKIYEEVLKRFKTQKGE